jgi:cellulose synthase/poly-beta-1,6-N-acetylglucosamine synthase-like glycosyltransferase
MAVVVPARDEEPGIGACVASLLAAADVLAVPTLVVVVAHRCTDRTADVAAALLPPVRGRVLADRSPTVATARAAGARAALGWASGLARPEATWLVSTDADTTVPRTWLADVAGHAAAGAAAVAGLVDVDHDPRTPEPARRAYRDLVAAGLTPRGHRHAYAANLAVRADAYLDVGGWPAVAPGEDRALLTALRLAGRPVVTAPDLVVRTSGRHRARAEGGLGTLLQRLSHGVTADPALSA